ncbi:MAG: YdeI/OmpD-associated family protein [Chitinophagaceae bacterium]
MQLDKKLKITAGARLASLNEPAGFHKTIDGPGTTVQWVKWGQPADQLHWFVTSQKILKRDIKKALGQLKPGVTLWIYYPKGSSGIQTDLTRDQGWDLLMAPENELTWLSLIAFDDTWSAFAVRKTTEKDLAAKKKKVTAVSPLDEYIDREKRIVHLPADLEKGLRSWPKARTFFDSLPFTHRKEYVEWIVSAKKEETRLTRVTKTVENMKQELKKFR